MIQQLMSSVSSGLNIANKVAGGIKQTAGGKQGAGKGRQAARGKKGGNQHPSAKTGALGGKKGDKNSTSKVEEVRNRHVEGFV